MLYAIDELTGLINATALMRPNKNILDLTPKSVKKKWSGASQPVWTAALSRRGVDMLGMDLTEVIDHTIKGMQKVAEDIGLGENCKNQVLTFTISAGWCL